MNGNERRTEILKLLTESQGPVSGVSLARQLSVSRQIIVQDIALLRAAGNDILSMNQGYMIQSKPKLSRVFKVIHEEQDVEEELNTIVDFGGIVKDVFVYHKAYGVLRAEMNIRSRLDIENFVEKIKSGKSNLLMNVTSGYHYHTVMADSEQLLDIIQDKLRKKGFLARLQDYEPVEFS
ncbi:MAG: transcription repressor NadR [Lentihominibacter sp.]|nr:transcription repressor NadR [Clostridiales bacterium]MDY2679241.1 transcription repressor NadR [Lentihominibacter sp.]